MNFLNLTVRNSKGLVNNFFFSSDLIWFDLEFKVGKRKKKKWRILYNANNKNITIQVFWLKKPKSLIVFQIIIIKIK